MQPKMQNKILKYGNIQAGYTSDVVYAMLYSNLNLLFVRGTYSVSRPAAAELCII